MTSAEWAAGARRFPVSVASGTWTISARVAGDVRECTTYLHGFPTCSYDWSFLSPRDGLYPDFLGFGASEKPVDHRYSLIEQADLIQGLWASLGVERVRIVAHDYAVSVTQELLACHAEGRTIPIDRVVFLNGGLYPDLHRAVLVQKLLRSSMGWLVSRLATEGLFTSNLRRVLARPPDDAVLHEMWASAARNDGHRLSHRLIRYIDDRIEHAGRWRAALEETAVPKAFIWGMRDPVSGAHVVPRLRERLPTARIETLDDIGHYPQVEDPERVRALLDDMLG